MTIIQGAHASVASTSLHATPNTAPSAGLTLLLATGAGIGVASLYYAQPMLGVLAQDLHTSNTVIGMLPTLTQLGYAAGILLLAPLGDRFDRRRIIVLKAVLLSLALLVSGLAPGIGVLLAAGLAVGLTATMVQDIVPAAATLAPEAQRGKIVGTVMTGLLLGILLSRVVSGFVAEHFGWRSVYLGAAGLIALIALAVWRGVPSLVPTTRLTYGALLGSLTGLWRKYPLLRKAAVAQALLSASFSAFWSTLAVMLHDSFGMGSAAAGAFGLAGMAGALIAPVAGRLADKRGPELVTRLGAGLVVVSFLAMALGYGLSPQAQLAVIVIGTLGFDLGLQAALVAHQTIVFSIDPGARSRLNAVLFTGMFIGMAAGAGLGSLALAEFGWIGVVGFAIVSSSLGLAVRMRRG